MHGTAGTAGSGNSPDGLAAPSFKSVLAQGLPGFLREGFLPLAAFYAGWRLSGTAAGIAAAALVSLFLYGYERRAGRDGLLVRLTLLFVAVQSAVGLLTASATVYLATPVVAGAVWAVVFLGSAAAGRPLAGALACAWYPFPPEFRRTKQFKRVYGFESVVWGLYLLGRSGVRLRPSFTAASAPSSSSGSSRACRRCSGSSPGRSGTRFASSRTTPRTRRRTQHSARRTPERADAHRPLARPSSASRDAVARRGRLAPRRAARHRRRRSHRGAHRSRQAAPGGRHSMR